MRRWNGCRVAIGEEPRRRLLLAAAAFDHVGRDRPRRPAEADQRQALGKLGHHALDGLVDRRQGLGGARSVQPGNGSAVSDWLELRTFTFDELDLLPKRIGDDENVGEDDRRVEIEPSQGLQRYLGCEPGSAAEIEEGSDLAPDLPIFGQIAAGLAHQPDRRRGVRLAGKRLKERTVQGRDTQHHLSLNTKREIL